MASKSKGRSNSMKMCSSTQLLMLVAVAAVMYMLFKGGCGRGSAPVGSTSRACLPEGFYPSETAPRGWPCCNGRPIEYLDENEGGFGVNGSTNEYEQVNRYQN